VSKLRQFGHKCRDCRQIVPSGARVCPNCKTFQDWRRFIAIGQTNLALLTAIISVATTFLAVAIPFFKQQGYRIELFLDNASETRMSVVARNTGNEGALLRLRMLRIGNSDFRPFEFVGASNYFQVELDHDGVYIEPRKEEKLVARFKSPVSSPLCEYIKGQPFFKGLKEMKESNTVGDAMTSVYAKMACAVGLHETSFGSSREFYFRPLNCSDFGDILGDCMTTEMLKALGKQN
jgi:RNA polymerase subunit RPABC4/transcription elongation factor Spt4